MLKVEAGAAGLDVRLHLQCRSRLVVVEFFASVLTLLIDIMVHSLSRGDICLYRSVARHQVVPSSGAY